jgi:hypothetical protein
MDEKYCDAVNLLRSMRSLFSEGNDLAIVISFSQRTCQLGKVSPNAGTRISTINPGESARNVK